MTRVTATRSARHLPGRLLVIFGVAAPIVFVVGGAIASTLAQSLGLMPFFGPARFSTDAYIAIGPELASAVGTSLFIATASTLIAVLVGTTAGVIVGTARWSGRLIAALGAGVITIPHIVGAATVGLLLADSGVLPRLLGIAPDAWPALVAGPWWVAVILEYAWKESAFIALIVAGTMATRVTRFDETALLLGARPLSRFRLVFLPLAAPSLIIGSAIVFVYTLGSYEVAWLLGRTFPQPLAVVAVRLMSDVSLTSRPEAAAVAVVTVVLALVVAGAAFAALRKMAVWR